MLISGIIVIPLAVFFSPITMEKWRDEEFLYSVSRLRHNIGLTSGDQSVIDIFTIKRFITSLDRVLSPSISRKHSAHIFSINLLISKN
jgi:hypothetical protein